MGRSRRNFARWPSGAFWRTGGSGRGTTRRGLRGLGIRNFKNDVAKVATVKLFCFLGHRKNNNYTHLPLGVIANTFHVMTSVQRRVTQLVKFQYAISCMHCTYMSEEESLLHKVVIVFLFLFVLFLGRSPNFFWLVLSELTTWHIKCYMLVLLYVCNL